MSDPTDSTPNSPSMSDIARATGLGRSTVSMALRNHPGVAVATRERVLKVAAELGYRPNPLISLLMSRLHEEKSSRHDTVLAVINERAANWSWRYYPMFQTMWAGIEEQARRRGYMVEEFLVGAHGLAPARLAQILRARGVPGVIVAPKYAVGPSAFTAWDEFACVTINWSVSAPALPRSCFDFYRNFVKAWEALVERGYERIGFIDNPGMSTRLGHQYKAANLALLDLLPASRRVTPLYLSDDLISPKNVRTWLNRERPDAVIVSDASYMVHLIREVAAVPSEVAIACVELANAPADCAGIDERVAEVGVAAVDMLIGRLQRNERGLPESQRILHVSGAWREGATVRPLVA